MTKIKKTAFTLAEVLITLVIIGVVAALTVPTLTKNINDIQHKAAYKKAFSSAAQALQLAVTNDKIETRTGWTDAQSKVNNFNAFKSYFKITRDCNNSNNTECWAPGENYVISYPNSSALAFVDSSGVSWSLTANTNITGAEILVDTNGANKPNKYGYDRFVIWPVPAAFPTDFSVPASAFVGLPSKLIPLPDFAGYDANNCPSGATHSCLYRSWLYN